MSVRDFALQGAGALAILVAIAHGAIAELQVFAKSHIEPRNAVATRGRHFGWCLMGGVVALALAGL